MSDPEGREALASSPRVSVIIPTYNRSGYLSQAIGSVVAQTYGDWEAIIIDDGSTDDTATVVVAMGDPRIRYYRQENAGRSAARNRGLELARGEFIAFLDDDDLYLPRKLELQVGFLDQHQDVDLVASENQGMDQAGQVTTRTMSGKSRQIDLRSCLQACPLATCNILLRRQALDRLASWFDPEMEAAEDLDFFLRLLRAGCHAEWLPALVSVNRSHSGSSQGNVVGYRAGYERLLSKLFADPRGLPEDILSHKAEVYAQYHLRIAFRAYQFGQYVDGQQDLLAAANCASRARRALPQVADEMAGLACQLQGPLAPRFARAYLDQVSRGLPRSRFLRAKTLSQVFMGRVFKYVGMGKRPSLRDWLLAIVHYPAWLRNRGVWSILLRRILTFPFWKPGCDR